MPTLVEYVPRIDPSDARYIKYGVLEDCGATVLGEGCRIEYGCTRDKGHEMPHVAHGMYDQMIASWID